MSSGRRPGVRDRLTDADLVVLGMLTVGPTHGHGMWCRLVECDIQDWAEVSRAQVYYSLRKLAEQDLIRPADTEKVGTARERLTWKITPAGRRALQRALASDHWATSRRVPPFMTWVGWSELASPAARRKVSADRRAFLESEVSREEDTIASMKGLPAEAPGVQAARSMIGHAIRQMKLEIDWLDELETLHEEWRTAV